ncbi:ATP-binding protein [Dyadobacter bucti]|uniref:ATP-binding protein n=1 Tax=Dyadobacter bucti TaxID=2572203 RepID=UPI003F6FEB55
MRNRLEISSKGIKKILRNYNAQLSIAEYIWNGFDADATIVNLQYSIDAFENVNEVRITDNGYGIDFEKLPVKFVPFYESEKAIEISSPKHHSATHGKNGVGRLTFFTFAHNARWTTAFESKNGLASGTVEIGVSGLHTYNAVQHNSPITSLPGTEVLFYNVLISKEVMENFVIPFLVSEFCWFLELNKAKGFRIIVNGADLDYINNILDYQETQTLIYEPTDTVFTFKYVQWKETLHKELSKFYFLSSAGDEVYKDFTTLNKKGDEFYHSVYIQSDIFDNFDFGSLESSSQLSLLSKAKSSPEYKFLLFEITKYLREKRKPFLREYGAKLVQQYEQDGIMPIYRNEWEKIFKKSLLEETIIGLYEVQPKLFISLNTDQKKTFVRLLDLLLDSNERDNLLRIIDEVVDLDTEERKDFVELFKTTKLNRIVDCIKLIEDRYKTYYHLRDLVFNPDLKANEVNHLQKVIENHYWLFGEQYHLVTAAEPKFDEALRRYHYLLYKEDTDHKLDHPHKYKEMDIFMCRQNVQINRIENIVVELKHPKIRLGLSQYGQVDKYLQTILNEPMFNAPNMSWEFYLIGNEFDSTGFIERLVETNANHGIESLVHWSDKGRIKVYVKKWSQIFAEFEMKHKFLNDKLLLERTHLMINPENADDIIKMAALNSAVQPEEVNVPKLA